MSHFENTDTALEGLLYMKRPQAEFIRDFIVKHDAKDILEIGFFRGKSSAYIAAVLEDLGRGHLTTIDREIARPLEPNIIDTLAKTGLSHRVTPIFAARSHTWELGRMIGETPRPQFDLCYFDGGHTWDVTGFGFFLVDALLRPGGWIIFDDLNWSITKVADGRPKRGAKYMEYDQSERDAETVRMVFDLLVPRLGYTNRREVKRFAWGIARKSARRSAFQWRPAKAWASRIMFKKTARATA